LSQSERTTREEDENAAEERYRAVVIFRNDDPEPGHRDELRRAVSELFIEHEIPITDAVIPTQDGESIEETEFCRELRQRRNEHPELVEYALHGYRHEPRASGFGRGGQTTEFAGLPYDEQRVRIAEGTRILAESLESAPRTFVPPYATYDETTVRALSDSGIDVISGSDWFTRGYFGETGVFETDGVLHVPTTHGFVRDWETIEFHDERDLRARFDDSYGGGGLYVQLLHYWTFNTKERFEQLRSFLEYIIGHDDLLYATVGEFSTLYRSGRLERVADGWLYRPSDETDPSSITSEGRRGESKKNGNKN
jgi:peptidoglycan/xylan/chitin deacetylase (PgdA/CDA1 family)